MRISVIQMSPGSDKADNIAQARRLMVAAIEADRPDLVMLPEMWSCLGGDQATKRAAAEPLPGPGGAALEGGAYVMLRDLARSHGLHVHGGSIGERCGDKIANTALVFAPDGSEIARYRKLHLFDVVTPNGEGYRESDTYVAGDSVVTARVGPLTTGLAICYDLRFPELFTRLRREGAELILLPAAFTAETGEAHWETLLRARAIETQCWVAAAGTCGRHVDGHGAARQTYGHSMVVDPWGTVVGCASNGPGWVTARIDPTLTERVRAGIPVVDHRRLT